MLCLIIFLWTPPHFWALALYRAEDYRKRRPADAAGDARQRVHPAAGAALHAGAVRRHAAALRLRHERLALPGRRDRARRRVHRLCAARSGAPTATRWRARPSASRSSTCRCCSRRCWSTTTCPLLTADTRGLATAAACAALRRRSRGCDVQRARDHSHGADITGADYAAARADRRRRPAAHAGRLQGQGRWCVFFGYTQCPDVCPTTHGRAGRRSSRRSAPTASACRCFRHRRPGARHAGGAEATSAAFDPASSRCAATPEQTQRAAKEFKVFYEKVPARRRQLHRWTTRAAAYVFDPQGGCGCSCATARPAWPRDLPPDLKRYCR